MSELRNIDLHVGTVWGGHERLVVEDQQHEPGAELGVGSSDSNLDKCWELAFKNIVSVYTPIP